MLFSVSCFHCAVLSVLFPLFCSSAPFLCYSRCRVPSVPLFPLIPANTVQEKYLVDVRGAGPPRLARGCAPAGAGRRRAGGRCGAAVHQAAARVVRGCARRAQGRRRRVPHQPGLPRGAQVRGTHWWRARARGCCWWLAPAARSHHMAYLVWTSGTTGAPKGVAIEHTAAVASMRSLQAVVPTAAAADVGGGGGVRYLLFSAATFDAFV